MAQSIQTITGEMFCGATAYGAERLLALRGEIDELNVFPVPDGDTGTNMSMTLSAGAEAAKRLPAGCGAGEACAAVSAAMLGAARGNSGVILSLIFGGFSESCRGKAYLDGASLAAAMRAGADAAYAGVAEPKEGTMLTVARSAAEAAERAAKAGGDVLAVLKSALSEGRRALSRTPEQLTVLKKAGVVDAGGRGFTAVLEGMYGFLTGGAEAFTVAHFAAPDLAAFAEEDIRFPYCAEFLIEKEGSLTAEEIRESFSALGDSLVVREDGDTLKIHLHTDKPEEALRLSLNVGQPKRIKIENMRAQLKDRKAKSSDAAEKKQTGLVAVCSGSGMREAFEELGCDGVVDGGRTMNPSAHDILEKCTESGAETVFVLPDNPNVVMAARQAARLETGRRIVVIPTQTVPQGIAAAIAFDPSLPAEKAKEEMEAAAQRVGTGQLACASKDSTFAGTHIKKGQVIALKEGKLLSVHERFTDGAVELASALAGPDTAVITLFAGQDSDRSETEEIEEKLKEGYPFAEVAVVYGGQPVYPYFISAES